MTGDERRIGQRRELDPLGRGAARREPAREGSRKPRLADAARPGDSDETMLAQPARQRIDVGIAAEEDGPGIGWRPCWRPPIRGSARDRLGRGHPAFRSVTSRSGAVHVARVEAAREPVAASRDCRYRVVTEQLAQRRDVDLQVVLLDDQLRPHAVEQRVLRHEPSRVLDQRDEQVERTRAQRQRCFTMP